MNSKVLGVSRVAGLVVGVALLISLQAGAADAPWLLDARGMALPAVA